MTMKSPYGTHSLRFRLVVACVLIQTVLLTGSIANHVALMSDSLTEQMESRLEELKPLLNAALAPLVMQRDYAALQDVLNEVVHSKGLKYIQVIDHHSKHMTGAGVIPASFSVDRDLSGTQQDHMYDRQQPLQITGQTVGHVRFGISTRAMEQAKADALAQGIGISLLVITATVTLLIIVSGFLTRHLLALAQGAQKIAAGDLNVIISADQRDEVGDTARAFNTMTVSLKETREEMRRLNGQLEQRVTERTAQLLIVNQELEAFSYSVSHDLRAPLRGIDGFSQALLEDYDDKLDESGKNMLRRVRAASQRMAQLIDDLLNLSRVTRYEMRAESVDLSLLARSIANDLQRTQPQRQVIFNITEGLTAYGDPRLMRIMLENLLSNAWKFTSKCEHADIQFGVSHDHGQPGFFVRDNGAGFDMAYAGKLFGPFQRLHATTEFEGTGIGLATVQRIIHRHGGHIWAHAAVGQGATFYFTLAPCRDAQVPRAQDAQERPFLQHVSMANVTPVTPASHTELLHSN